MENGKWKMGGTIPGRTLPAFTHFPFTIFHLPCALMLELFKTIVTHQFEASLCMLNDCIEKCPADHWDGIIGKYAFWHVAYHTLCFADLYLSPGEKSFQMRAIHPTGWNEFEEEYPSRRFEKAELSEYLALCRKIAVETIATETKESLEGPSGFERRTFPRAELHLYNIRHIQHHVGQLSSYLRKLDKSLLDPAAIRWVGSGWK
jgi:hypothetical protein